VETSRHSPPPGPQNKTAAIELAAAGAARPGAPHPRYPTLAPFREIRKARPSARFTNVCQLC